MFFPITISFRARGRYEKEREKKERAQKRSKKEGNTQNSLYIGIQGMLLCFACTECLRMLGNAYV